METCLSPGVIFLGDEKKILASYEFPYQSSSECLLPLIEKLLKKVNLPINKVQALVVSKGPGSFTASRIGVSLAKSLSFCLNLKLIGVPTLDCLAFSLPSSGFICSLIPAYRRSFFAAFFYKDGENLKRKSDYLFLPWERVRKEAEKFLPEKITFVFSSLASIPLTKLNYRFTLFQGKLYLDKVLLKWALREIKLGREIDPLILTPQYVSPPLINNWIKDERFDPSQG